jgi:nucleotide-binding universal stress UspA family protein
MYRNVIVAYDGSAGARAALERAAAVAGGEGASLTLVESTAKTSAPVLPEIPPEEADAGARARKSLEQAVGALDPELSASSWVVGGPPAAGILAVADEIKADLIVTGSRGRGQVASALLGSTATELVQQASCDVLVVHPTDD